MKRNKQVILVLLGSVVIIIGAIMGMLSSLSLLCYLEAGKDNWQDLFIKYWRGGHVKWDKNVTITLLIGAPFGFGLFLTLYKIILLKYKIVTKKQYELICKYGLRKINDE